MVKTVGQHQQEGQSQQLQQSLQRRVQQEWQKDSSSCRLCAVSGEGFTLLRRRHHCRVSGICVNNAFSLFTQTLPEMNHIWWVSNILIFTVHLNSHFFVGAMSLNESVIPLLVLPIRIPWKIWCCSRNVKTEVFIFKSTISLE